MKRFKHPITGESITLGEHLSWTAQNAIRRWEFVGVVTLATVVCWGIGTAGVLQWWNFAASYMAVLIELVVGIAKYQQTKADAKVIRKILAMEDHQFSELKRLIEKVEDDLEIYHEGDGDEPR